MIESINTDIAKSDWWRIVLAAIASLILYVVLGISTGSFLTALDVDLTGRSDYIANALYIGMLAFIIPIPLAALFAFFLGYKLTGKKVCGIIAIAVGIGLTVLLVVVLNVLLSIYVLGESLFV